MKNLIITISAVVLILSITEFQLQCNDMLRQKKMMKYISEEAAAAAALCYDADAFGDGYLRFDRKNAEHMASKMIKLNTREQEGFDWEITFDDEAERPSVTVKIAKGRLTAVSVYEYAGC